MYLSKPRTPAKFFILAGVLLFFENQYNNIYFQNNINMVKQENHGMDRIKITV